MSRNVERSPRIVLVTLFALVVAVIVIWQMLSGDDSVSPPGNASNTGLSVNDEKVTGDELQAGRNLESPKSAIDSEQTDPGPAMHLSPTDFSTHPSRSWMIDRGFTNEAKIYEADQLQSAPIAALKYKLVAEMRGDLLAAPNEIRSLMNRYSYGPKEIVKACRLAEAEFQSLNDERMQMGYATFDNSPPPQNTLEPAFGEVCGYPATDAP